MRLDRILQVLLPKDVHFFSLFEESAQNIVHAASALMNLPLASTEERTQIIAEIKKYEHEGDVVTHKIFANLSGTFVTPFDPEDIHVLASALDDILDNIDGAAGRFLLYQVRDVPPDMVKLIRSLHGSVLELQRGVQMLRRLHKSNDIQAIVERVNAYENEADSIFEAAVADLFVARTDPIEIIKLKEIYVSLETATDNCEDAADVLETIMIKHA